MAELESSQELEIPDLAHPPSTEASEDARSPTLVESGEDAPKPAEKPKLTYSISMFSLCELAKAKTKREPENHIMTMSADAPWIDVQDQLKIHIIDGLFAGENISTDSAQYRMFYTVRPTVKDPISLASEKDHNSLLEFVAPQTKSRNISIIVNELAARKDKDKQKTSDDSEGDERPAPSKKKKSKTKAEKKSEELPGNVAINKAIQTVQSERMEVPIATLETPPHHQLFDAAATRGEPSPLLQARLNAAAKEKAGSAVAAPGNAPVINFVLPNDMFGMFRDVGAQPPAAPAPVAPPDPLQASGNGNGNSLIPSGLKPGPKLSLGDFCEKYNLPEGVLTRFTKNAYRYATGFRYMSVSDLEKMGFKSGEIAEIQEAVESWVSGQ
ncbi:hypothetical protein EST38_g7747 [Candolleomyces aberdarensis]|uniref:Uncharacterized protein n=1 Tax=Candolleomyces aberdarensis TaxID=2316362 RepID=A0A4V1Q3C5_9AGAR|nr:hypothetical protein EST38_g7747 [Candolleomyces aberdarensis]